MSEELLDDLDVEVPTAASKLENPEVTVIYNYKDKLDDDLEPGKLHHDIKALVVPEEQRRKTAILGLKINGDELVRREDHREALVEAVQSAREQERRRILKMHEKLKKEEIKKHGHKPKSYEHAKERLLERIREGLEEEVQK